MAVPTIGMSAHDDSPLAESVSVHLRLAPPDATPDEACPWDLAPTTSTTLQLAAGDALALAAAEGRGFGPDEFARRHPGGALGAALRPIGSMLRFRVGRGGSDSVLHTNSEPPCGPPVKPAKAAARALLLTDDRGVLEGIMTDGDLRRLLLDNPEAIDGPAAESMTKVLARCRKTSHCEKPSDSSAPTGWMRFPSWMRKDDPWACSMCKI